MSDFVVAGCPVRNRAWILPRHLEAVQANTPQRMLYVYGDCEDGTADALYRHAQALWVRFDTGYPGWKRDGKGEERYHSRNMSRLRNYHLLESTRHWPDLTHVWSVDSDVLPEPDVLDRLLAVDQPIVGAYVPIGPENDTPIFTVDWDREMGQAKRRGCEKLLGDPLRATLVGACVLIRRDAIDAGIHYGVHPQGEDGHFCDEARALGLGIWVDPMARCQHVYEEEP